MTQRKYRYKNAPQCSATTIKGERCKKPAMVDRSLLQAHKLSDDPHAGQKCLQHLIGEEAWREIARKGGLARVAQVRAAKAPAMRSGLRQDVTLDRVLAVASEALTATFEDAGLPREIDWTTRLLACLVILNVLKDSSFRRTPEQLQAALEAALPTRVRDDPESMRWARVERLYKEARSAWFAHVSADGVLADSFSDVPPWLIAPWESRTEVEREARLLFAKRESALAARVA
jgi:hypothetical protein